VRRLCLLFLSLHNRSDYDGPDGSLLGLDWFPLAASFVQTLVPPIRRLRVRTPYYFLYPSMYATLCLMTVALIYCGDAARAWILPPRLHAPGYYPTAQGSIRECEKVTRPAHHHPLRRGTMFRTGRRSDKLACRWSRSSPLLHLRSIPRSFDVKSTVQVRRLGHRFP